MRGLPDLKMLGLPRNVLVWDGEQLALTATLTLTLNPDP